MQFTLSNGIIKVKMGYDPATDKGDSMSKTPIAAFSEDAILEAFHNLSKEGDDILLPLSTTEDVLKRKERRGENEITSYLHRFDFGSFFLSILYTPRRSDLTSAPSTLEARICLDKTETLFFFMPYDIIPYINPKDMICRYFPYIESPERLVSCYRDLAESLVPYLDDFERIANDEAARQRAYRDLKNEMARCYGENIDIESGKGEDYDRALMSLRFCHFVKWKSSFYASAEYGAYLSGDPTALSAIAFRGARPDYVKHLALSSVGQAPGSLRAVREESASLPDMLSATKHAKTLRTVLLTFALTLPLVAAVLVGIYFLVAGIVSGDSIYDTALTFTSLRSIFTSILFGTGALSLITYPLTLRLFHKKRFEAFYPYHQMAKVNEKKRLLPKARYLLLALVVIFTIGHACQGVRFFRDEISIQVNTMPSAPKLYEYDDIEEIERITRTDGSFYYLITFDDTAKITLKDFMTSDNCEEIEEKLAPLFRSHGIVITEKSNENESPSHDNTNKA